MARRAPRPDLAAEQSVDADRLHMALLHAVAGALRALAEALAAATDGTIFGATEFVVRDSVLGIGAKAVEVALADRAEKVVTAAASAAPPAPRPPGIRGGSPAPPSPSSARSG